MESSTQGYLRGVSLLSLTSSEGMSSGYDTDSVLSDTTPLLIPSLRTTLTPEWNPGFRDVDTDTDSDDDFSDCLSASFSEYEDESDDENEAGDVIKYDSTETLVRTLEEMLSMPHLCDTVFYVGREREPLYAVKAILATRSRVLYQMVLHESKSREVKKRKDRKSPFGKTSKHTMQPTDKVHITIDDCHVDIFRSVLTYIHTGVVKLTPSNLVGVLCAAVQYDLPELREICRDFVDQCVAEQSSAILMTLLKSAKHYQMHRVAQKLSNKIYAQLDTLKIGQEEPSDRTLRKETAV